MRREPSAERVAWTGFVEGQKAAPRSKYGNERVGRYASKRETYLVAAEFAVRMLAADPFQDLRHLGARHQALRRREILVQQLESGRAKFGTPVPFLGAALNNPLLFFCHVYASHLRPQLVI